MRWKNKLNGIKGRFDIAEEKLGELEDTIWEIPTRNREEKEILFYMNKESVSSRTISSGLTYIERVPEERRELETEKISEELMDEIFQIWWNLSP